MYHTIFMKQKGSIIVILNHSGIFFDDIFMCALRPNMFIIRNQLKIYKVLFFCLSLKHISMQNSAGIRIFYNILFIFQMIQLSSNLLKEGCHTLQRNFA